VATTGLLGKLWGGSATLGQIAGTKYPAQIAGMSGEVIGMIVGVALIALAFALPDRLAAGTQKAAPAE
jgi:hypothetical protein